MKLQVASPWGSRQENRNYPKKIGSVLDLIKILQVDNWKSSKGLFARVWWLIVRVFWMAFISSITPFPHFHSFWAVGTDRWVWNKPA